MSTTRRITKAEIEEYHQNGVVKLLAVFGIDWIDRLRKATEVAMTNPGPHAEEYAKGGGGFFGDINVAKRNDTFRDFINHSGAAKMMGTILKSEKINFFYDQLLVKEPGTSEPTPWHQDQPYWAVSGQQVAYLVAIRFDEKGD